MVVVDREWRISRTRVRRGNEDSVLVVCKDLHGRVVAEVVVVSV
jgi:hypothetical protein